ncbi:MAG: hypothetical protein NC309_11930 [Ruminococcus sp.]|nr:hypothetical protein [Ruminococcus sp.]
MSIFEYDAELHMKLERAEAFEDGRAEGIEQGIERGMEQGIEQGIKQGIEQGNKQSALRMIYAGKLSLEEIALYSNLTLEQVLELEKELQPV